MNIRIAGLRLVVLLLQVSWSCLPAAAAPAPHIVFMIGEPEYQTGISLPEFAHAELEPRGIRCTFVMEDPKDTNYFPGLEAIRQADLLFISVRRHTPSKEQMSLIRDYVASRKAIAGIRTASHAFGAKPRDDQHEGWDTFDSEVLGGSYGNHYRSGKSVIQIASGSADHPIVRDLGVKEFANDRLYRNPTIAPTATALLTGHMEGDGAIHNIAWVNTNQNRRVFYTSLGTPDDFKTPVFRRLLLNGILWALDRPAQSGGSPETPPPAKKKSGAKKSDQTTGSASWVAPADSKPLSPAESMKHFHVADDLEIEQVLAEPIVAQPVFLNFDERGRMWVVQYRQYPAPAGLKAVSHDGFWRAVYDKVPPPPPHHFRGLDRITIHESTRHDGIFDKHKTFVDGLNITTAVERGRGGVWVLNPPYLLFYPDANNDDIPDGDPVVHLAGFGLEDTHSVANSLRWGPDGWLYGAQGSTVTGHIMRPGLDTQPVFHTMGQLIWRYHPETRRFEIFSEGGGNAFGVEIDARGRIFSGHNGGNTRGFYYQQGAYEQKGFEKHGPLSNPYAFGYFPPMKHPAVERFTHNFIIYDGGTLPEHYWGRLFGAEPLQGRVVESEITPDQSSFKTSDLGHIVTSDDRWFRPVDIKVGPDGAIYVCDWYDQQVNHFRNQEGSIDPSNGRIYRIKSRGAKPGQAFDLARLSSSQLVELLGHTNKWFRQTALRLIADRNDKSIVPALSKLVEEKTGQISLEALWALHLCGALTESFAIKALDHPDPFVRLWTARLLGDENKVSPETANKLAHLAQIEQSLEARDALACSARRLPAKDDLAIVRNLLGHDEDAPDNRIPLLLWWAIESKAESDRDQVIGLFEDTTLWSHLIVKQDILERIMRRYALAGTRKDLLSCAKLFELSPSREHSQILVKGFEAAMEGRSLAGMPDELLRAMARFEVGSVPLGLREGKPDAVKTALQTIADNRARPTARLQYIGILGEVNIPESVPVLVGLIEHGAGAALVKAAMNALQHYDDPKIGAQVVALYNQFDASIQPTAQSLLSSRAIWARQWLLAMDSGLIKPDGVSQNVVRTLRLHRDEQVQQLAGKLFPNKGRPTTAEMEKQIKRLAGVIRGGVGDPYNGRTLFQASCAACHTLFGQGGQVGPDLTPYKRDELDTLLLNIVNPSAEIREGYENYLVEMKDERSLNGFLVEQNSQVVVLRGLDGQNAALDRKDIVKLGTSGMSLMPEGLLDGMNDQQARDLFAYLRSSQPLVGK